MELNPCVADNVDMCTEVGNRGAVVRRSHRMSPFVGASRFRLVDGLLAVYDSVVEAGRPVWVSLEAPSGWGKTRVVREFYGRLAARQSKPVYWPRDIEDPDRKATHPSQFIRAARSLPEFLWWGIPCSLQAGRLNTHQLDIHEPYIKKAWQKLISRRERAYSGLVTTIRRLMRAGPSDLLSRLVAWLAGTTVPGLGLVLDLAYDRLRDAYTTHQAFVSTSTIDEGDSSDAIEVTVDFLVQVSKPGLPIVIFLDDLHRADNTLVDLVSKILSRNSPIMIVTTTWPDIIDSRQDLSRLTSLHRNRLHRVHHTGPAGGPFPADSGLFELDEEARASIISSYYSRVESTTKTALLQRYTNPLELELFCQIGKFRSKPLEYLPNGELTLSAAELERLPQNIRELRRDLWRELPNAIRFALAVAHIMTPASISSAEAAGEDRWLESLLREVILNLEYPDSESVVAAIDKVPSAYAWIQFLDVDLRAFAETTQKQIAADDGYALLEDQFDNPRMKILGTLASSVATTWGEGSEAINRSQSVLALSAEGFITDQQVIADAIKVQLSELMNVPRAFRERARLFDKFTSLDSEDISDETSFVIRLSATQVLHDVGRIGEAMSILEELSLEMSTSLGSGDPLVLVARNNWGASLGESGQVEEAIAVYGTLLSDCMDILDPGHPLVATVANNFAHWLGVGGRSDEAIAVYRTILSSSESHAELDGDDLLIARNNLANLLGEAGRIDEALASYEQLLADRQRMLGPEHPDTLTTRNNRALWLGRAGRMKEACSEFSEVLEARGRALGNRHPATLAARANLANWLAEAGKLEVAIAEYARVIEEHEQVFGTDHPKSFIARSKLALRIGETGRIREAIATLNKLLTDQQQVLGPDDPETLQTRYLLASYIGELGDTENAVLAYRDLLVDCERVLGADHLETLATRNNLAGWLAESGRTNEAIGILEDLLPDTLKVLGPYHPFSLAIRTTLTGLRGDIGD